MKKLLASALLMLTVASAHAVTFMQYGVLMGTVCRSGPYYTVYPVHMAQPVGSSCPVRDPYGYTIGYGYVTAE